MHKTSTATTKSKTYIYIYIMIVNAESCTQYLLFWPDVHYIKHKILWVEDNNKNIPMYILMIIIKRTFPLDRDTTAEWSPTQIPSTDNSQNSWIQLKFMAFFFISDQNCRQFRDLPMYANILRTDRTLKLDTTKIDEISYRAWRNYHSRTHWRWNSCLQLVTWKPNHAQISQKAVPAHSNTN